MNKPKLDLDQLELELEKVRDEWKPSKWRDFDEIIKYRKHKDIITAKVRISYGGLEHGELYNEAEEILCKVLEDESLSEQVYKEYMEFLRTAHGPAYEFTYEDGTKEVLFMSYEFEDLRVDVLKHTIVLIKRWNRDKERLSGKDHD